jgi:hypothetical protein
VGVEIRSHTFLTTALEVRGYIHVMTVSPIGKVAVYKRRENVPLRANLQIKKKKATPCLWP